MKDQKLLVRQSDAMPKKGSRKKQRACRSEVSRSRVGQWNLTRCVYASPKFVFLKGDFGMAFNAPKALTHFRRRLRQRI